MARDKNRDLQAYRKDTINQDRQLRMRTQFARQNALRLRHLTHACGSPQETEEAHTQRNIFRIASSPECCSKNPATLSSSDLRLAIE